MEEIQLIKNRQNGRIIAAIVTAIFIIFFVLNLLSKQNPPPGQPGIEIQFGEEDMGMNDDSDPFAEEPNLEEFAEEEVVEETVEEVVEEVTDPSPKEVVTDDASNVPVPKKTETKPKKETKPTKTQKPTKETGKKSNEPRKPIGTFKKGDGKGTGTGGKTGPQGDPDGTGTSTTGGSVGNTVGGGLAGRKFTRSVPENTSSHFGTVVIAVCVDKDGKVIEASYTQKGSTTGNGTLVSLAEDAAKKFRFERNPYAPDKQCGTITFKFKPG